MKNFVAIDFETANEKHCSICSIGVVIVRDGEIVDRFYELVKPAPNYYRRWATDCHGLSHADTRQADLFPEVWKRIASRLEHLTLVAHNKGFDEDCLKKCHEHYKMPYPNYSFLCTLYASRQQMKGLKNYQLHTVSQAVGFELENHHNALADAEACAYIAMKLF